MKTGKNRGRGERTDPALDHVCLPHELEVGRVVLELGLAPGGAGLEGVEARDQLVQALLDRVPVVVALLDQSLARRHRVPATLTVHRKVCLKRLVLLQQALRNHHEGLFVKHLHGSHGVSIVLDGQELLLLGNPGLFFLHLGQKLLVHQRLVQLVATITGHLQTPRLLRELEGLEALLDLGHAQVGLGHELVASLLHRLDGRLVGPQLRVQALVLLAQVLHPGQVPAVVVGPHQQLLLSKESPLGRSLDPGLLVGDVPEELVQGVGLVQAGAAVGGQGAQPLVALVDGRPLLLDGA
ncbi:unnamed protein product [Ixodes pacificus]